MYKPEKKNSGLHRTHGLCVSAAVLYQLSYEDQYIGSRQFVEFILTGEVPKLL